MRIKRLSLFGRMASLIPGIGQVRAPDPTPGDEAAIREVIARFDRAFAQRDARIYASSFTDDADWENAFGGREQGRTGIERRLTRVYTLFQEAERESEEARIRFITGDVAVVNRTSVYSGQVNTSGQPVPPRRVRSTYIMHKTGGEWRVDLYRAADLREVGTPR